jgi:hypothetical protein
VGIARKESQESKAAYKYKPVKRKLGEESGNRRSKITKLVDSIGAKISTRSSRGLK